MYLVGLLEGETAKLIQEVESGTLVEPNGLSSDARGLVHYDNDIDIVAPLVLAEATLARNP